MPARRASLPGAQHKHSCASLAHPKVLIRRVREQLEKVGVSLSRESFGNRFTYLQSDLWSLFTTEKPGTNRNKFTEEKSVVEPTA